MLPNLPFAALRAFEAVVRLSGFGRAAEELNVTQSSVSQHVKAVEEWIGYPLLVRGPRLTSATHEGQVLALAISAGINQVSDASRLLRRKDARRATITLSCPPGFAVNWLFPRLIRFDQQHPEIPVSIATNSDLQDVATGRVNMAIAYGIGQFPGLLAERLMSERIFPVCSASLIEANPIKSIEDLGHHTFLLDELSDKGGAPPTWSYWANETGHPLPSISRARHFGQANMVVQAAVQGLGVAMGREPLVIDALQSSSLIRPVRGVALSEYGYWIVTSKSRPLTSGTKNFCIWLRHEAATSESLGDLLLNVHEEARPASEI